MQKRVLAIYYTQSGQMGQIIDSLTQPLERAGATVEKVIIKPKENFDFPWTGKRFFAVMPSCQLDIPTEIEPLSFKEDSYDLIILAYQPWFLSPSIPVTSALHQPEFRRLLKDTPVLTISAARNMWLSAFERLRASIAGAGANHIGNIALVDRHPNFVSFVTIFYWMLSGKKKRYLNIFPKPGVADEDIEHTKVFGQTVANYLQSDTWNGLQDDLVKQGAVRINYSLMVIESKAKIMFKMWAKFIVRRNNRVPWITAFKYYLFIALFLGAPILLTLDAIFLKPFSRKRISLKTLNYLMINPATYVR